jgi:protein ImuB
MRLWIGLHLSKLPLEVFEPTWSNSVDASVVIEQEKVLATSNAARAAGIRPGMRRGSVVMLDPEARVHERSLEKEADALQAVSLAMLQYSPEVAEGDERILLLSVGASLQLFSGVRALCRRVRADLRAFGFTAHVSCAPTARGAWLLARCDGGRTVQQKSMVRELDRLPVVAIPAARPFASWFEGLGCTTISHLRRLPRPGLQRRCGRQLLDTIDGALGEAPELFEWLEAPTTFEAKVELFDRIESAELLLAGAQGMVAQLCGWLCAKQLALEAVSLFLEHERGRQKRPPSSIEITLGTPVWESDHIIRLLKERLSTTVLEAPVIGMALVATKLRALEPPSMELFADPGGTEEDQVRVIELLISRLGTDAVKQSKPAADYRPEVANVWVPVQDAMQGGTAASQLPPNINAMLRPTWLLPKPIPLLIRAHRPFYSSPLRIVAGPERVEAGWWSDGATRDYFVAQGEGDKALYWIYRERIAGTNGGEDPRFFLHGLFG